MHTLLRIAAVLSTAALATAQIPLPPHSTTYNGLSRGFNFTASIPFDIVGLDLPLDAFQTGDTAAYAVRVNGTMALLSVGNAGPITTSLTILPGDVVDIIGNWSPAVPTTSTAHNSYGSTAPYATTIEGVAHTLNRTGVQNDISNPAWVPGTQFLSPSGGSIGRVFVFTAPVTGTVASNQSYGAPCGGSPLGDGTFYELFNTANPVDIANTSYTMTWSGNGYVVTPGATPFYTPTGADLGLGDDVVVTIPLPFSLPTPAGVLNEIYLGSNGYIGFQAGLPGDFTETVAELLAQQTRLCFFWDDLQPNAAASGDCTAELDGSGVFQITFTDVPEWGTTNLNTFQVSLNPNGDIELKYGNIGSSTGIVGFSTGNGATDPGAIDLLTALPLVVNTGALVADLTLTGATRPVIGTNWDLVTDGIDAVSPVSITFFGDRLAASVSLPTIGIPAPGCEAHINNIFGNLTAANVGGTSTITIAVPNAPSLVGALLSAQSLSLSLTNPAGIIVSNGVEGLVGDF